MVMNRLMVNQTPKDGLIIRDIMVESFWKESDARMKVLDKASMTNKKRAQYMAQFTEEFAIAMYFYDMGLLKEDDKELAHAVWRRFFMEDEHPDGPRIELV